MGRPTKFEERSDEILRAFEVCVARRGLNQTTLADVAAEAGLPRSLVRYFMGNRDDMIDLLVERLMSRAEASVAKARDAAGDAALETLLDLYCGEVFANDLSNAVIGELWHAATEDEHVKARLKGIYDYAIDLLAGAMHRERMGQREEDRRAAAFAIVSLALGESTLKGFGVLPITSAALRDAARAIVDSLRINGEIPA